MYGDFSRGHEPDRKRGRSYRRVLLQMGRPVLDSDVAASVDAVLGEVRAATRGLSCAAGSPDLGFLVTPGRLLAIFAEAADGLKATAGRPSVWIDYRHRYLDRYPALHIAASGKEDAHVTLPSLASFGGGEAALWAHVEKEKKENEKEVTINGSSVPLRPTDAPTRFRFDLPAGTFDAIDIVVPSGREVWLFLLEAHQSAGHDPTFWVAPGSYHVDGLIVDTAGGDFPSVSFPRSSGFPWDKSPPFDPPRAGLLAPPANGAGARLVAYLELHERHISHVEDPGIREEALGTGDTSTRAQLVGQVKLATLASDAADAANARKLRAAFGKVTASGGTLTIGVPQSTPTSDPCALPDPAGYSGADNRLYRVEVHRGGDLSQVLLKWSRDNGSELFAATTDTARKNLFFDAGTPLAAGDIVEVLSHVVDLGDQALAQVGTSGFVPSQRAVGQLVELAAVASSDKVVFALLDLLDGRKPVTLDNRYGTLDQAVLKLRRWHGILDPNRTTHVLEDGIEVTLNKGSYRPGQYWQYEARVRHQNANGPWRPEPHGPERRFAPLALLEYHNDNDPLTLLTWLDERFSHPCDLDADAIAFAGGRVGSGSDTVQEVIEELFDDPPLGLFYVSGDRQRGMAKTVLALPLQVGVARGETPVEGVPVQFEIEKGGGTIYAVTAEGKIGAPLTGPMPVPTGTDGIAGCFWQLGEEKGPNNTGGNPQILRARLPAEGGHAVHLPVLFTADFGSAEVVTGIHVTGLHANGGATELRNDKPLPANELAEGIRIACDDTLLEKTLKGKPTCFVTLELPYPLNTADRDLWKSGTGLDYHPIGRRPITLDAEVTLAAEVKRDQQRSEPPPSVIVWTPSETTAKWLNETLFRVLSEIGYAQPVLSRLTLKGNFIMGADEHALNLDGDAFALDGSLALRLPSGDQRTGGDLEMWFWLTSAEREVALLPLERPDANALHGLRLVAGDLMPVVVRLSSWTAVAVPITLTASPSNGVSFPPTSPEIPMGQDRITFDMRTTPDTSGVFEVSATSSRGQVKASITVIAFVGLFQAPVGTTPLSNLSVFAGDQVNAMARLTGAAPRALTVGFKDAVGIVPPAPVVIPQGSNSANFVAGTTPGVSGQLRVTAKLEKMEKVVTIQAVTLKDLRTGTEALAGKTVIASDKVTAFAQLSGPAPRPAQVTFKDVVGAQVPSTPVQIASGQARSPDFQLTTAPVAGAVSITAVLGPMTIKSDFQAVALDTLVFVSADGKTPALEMAPVNTGSSINARVRLTGPAPGDVTVNLTAGDGLSVTPQAVTIKAGTTSGDFKITGHVTGPSPAPVLSQVTATLLQLTQLARIVVQPVFH